ncbi:MAG: FAD:protein FMN transferase, partial [Candidatus Limnocylindria bacterium]
MRAHERAFRVMGTDARIVLHAADDSTAVAALERAEIGARAIESRFSRFIETSELSRLNAAGGAWCDASAELREVLALASELHRETEGLFDPAILPALERAGYDMTFERVAQRVMPASVAPRRERPFDVAIAGDRVRLGPGLRIDLGGIVKGWAADRLADELATCGPALVDLGGDCALRGEPPEGRWIVAVERPDRSAEPLAQLALGPGGVATSGTNRRRWRSGERWSHHLVDPRTGGPAETDLDQVTALHPSAARAEVWAKTALVAGSVAAQALAGRVAGLELMLVP